MAFRPPAREGISPRKAVLHGTVPAAPQYWAAEAGDSPFPAGALLEPGTRLECPIPAWYHPEVPPEPPIPFDYQVLYADEHLLVVDKPHFLPTTSNGRIVRETLQTRLRVDMGNGEIVPLHRLDRLTAGVVVCSVNPRTRGLYQHMFQDRQMHKTYRARVTQPLQFEGMVTLRMAKPHGSRQVVVDPAGTPTQTFVRASGKDVELQPLTGHTHQLRVLLNHLGSPICGDDTYPVDKGLALYDFSEPLQLVHERLEFIDPICGARRQFFAAQG